MEKNIAQHIEHNAITITCQHDVLWLRSYELHSGGWTPTAVVLVPVEAGHGEQALRGEAMVAGREAAEEQAFLIGKRWIDQHRTGRTAEIDGSRQR